MSRRDLFKSLLGAAIAAVIGRETRDRYEPLTLPLHAANYTALAIRHYTIPFIDLGRRYGEER